ncbi:MAG: Ig-like domain-containing protein [Bdellovibrio sp.]
MRTKRRFIVIAIMGSLLLSFGLFQNCAPHRFAFGDVQMTQLMSSAALYFETNEDTPLIDKVPRAAGLANESSTVSVSSSPKHGDITLNPSGDFTYTPYKNYYGDDEFEYSETGAVTTANLVNKKVLIHVISVNDLPWLDTDLVNFDMNTPAQFILIGHDVEDPQVDVTLDETGTTKSIKTSNGILEMLAPGSFKYSPAEFFRGVDSFEFVLKDSSGAVVKKKVTLMVGNPFHDLKPALAVRGPACMSCHANIDSALVTDFGKGSPYDIAKHPPFSYGTTNPYWYYGDHTGFSPTSISGSWITSTINGTVTVPATTLGFDSAVEIKKLTDAYPGWMNAVYPNQYTADQINSVVTATLAKPEYNLASTAKLMDFVKAIESHKATPASVEEKATVYIGAPSAKTILLRADITDGTKLKFIKNNQTTSPSLSGIDLQSGGYYQNSSTVVCDGDLVVDGTLFLNNLVLKTDDGCRIMTTGPIFVQGPITYQRIDTTRAENYTNLQLSSARFISLGIGTSNCENKDTNPGWYSSSPNDIQNPFAHRYDRYGTFTRLTGIDATLLAQDKAYNVAEASKIVGLKDASCYGGSAPRQISLERLLLNAPRVDSRFTGQFNGVVISEAALFSLSKFTFKYDSVFDHVPILPILLPDDFFVVKK